MIDILKTEWQDVAKVLGFNSFTFGFVTFASAEQFLKLLLLLVSIIYTTAKTCELFRKAKRERKE